MTLRSSKMKGDSAIGAAIAVPETVAMCGCGKWQHEMRSAQSQHLAHPKAGLQDEAPASLMQGLARRSIVLAPKPKSQSQSLYGGGLVQAAVQLGAPSHISPD